MHLFRCGGVDLPKAMSVKKPAEKTSKASSNGSGNPLERIVKEHQFTDFVEVEEAKAEFEKRRADYEAKANQQLSGAEARRAQLENASITLKANASPEGKLFGSVGPRDIAEAFTAAGTTIEKSEVVMAEGPIRHIGEFEVQIHLHADVHTTVKVTVVADE